MKSIFTVIFSIIIFLITATGFSQDLADQEIGFDAAKQTLYLKKAMITSSADIDRQIDHMREMHKVQYIEMKKIKGEILQRMQSKRLLKSITSVMDVSQSEKAALKALFDSTNGPNWINNAGWDFSTPVTTYDDQAKTGWHGIIVDNGHVVFLDLNYNNLDGFIPSEIGQLEYLKLLGTETNNLNGSIPEEIGKLINLEFLSLSNNKLSGDIPQTIYDLIYLSYFALSKNMLTGELSSKLTKLTDLGVISLHLNQLSGEIPLQIGNLQKLGHLSLACNQLTGSIPPEIGQLKNLSNIFLYNNKLTGVIPPEIGLLKNLEMLSLEENQLSGKIPPEISAKYIFLNSNLLEGTIPYLSVSHFLDISSNQFRFIDFSTQFSSFKTKMKDDDFIYSSQAKTDTAKTIYSIVGNSTTLTMCEDDRFTLDDTFQWYKDNSLISGAISRTYTISNLKLTDSGTYTCKSYHTNNPDMSPLVLEREPITLYVNNCQPIIGTIKVIN